MTARQAISATSTRDSGSTRKGDGATERKRPTRAHLLYLEQRADLARRAYRVAITQRLGATIIKRRMQTWHLRNGELEAALARLAAAMPAKEAA